ncbi:MAG: hypothetical protein HY558_07235 [Euryarchaeota archaeon]|nr:hypothetical protein [Euryarchaeota archaeon]
MSAPISKAAWILPLLAGLLAIGAGLYLLAQPDGLAIPAHANYLHMTSAQLRASNPVMLDFITQEVRLIGVLLAGTGFLAAAVSWGGLRRGQRWAWYALAGSTLASLGTVLVCTGHHPITDEGFLGLAVIAALQALGLLLGTSALRGAPASPGT